MITLVSVLKGVTKFVLKFYFARCLCEKFDLSKYLLASTYSKKDCFYSYSFRQRHPTIEKKVAPSLDL